MHAWSILNFYYYFEQITEIVYEKMVGKHGKTYEGVDIHGTTYKGVGIHGKTYKTCKGAGIHGKTYQGV